MLLFWNVYEGGFIDEKVLLSIVSGAVLLLGACSVSSDKEVKALDEKKITVGVTGGPHEQIFEKVKEVADKRWSRN